MQVKHNFIFDLKEIRSNMFHSPELGGRQRTICVYYKNPYHLKLSGTAVFLDHTPNSVQLQSVIIKSHTERNADHHESSTCS